MTPAASATSSIDVAWKPRSREDLDRDDEQLGAALLGGESHRHGEGRYLPTGRPGGSPSYRLDFSGIS